MKTLSLRCHKGYYSAAVTAYYRLVRERRVYWQKPERLTSEKETKLNWISARLLMLLQSQAFPKALDTILMQKDIKETLNSCEKAQVQAGKPGWPQRMVYSQ